MKTIFFLILLTLMVLACGQRNLKSPADWVNPFIGTGGHGHTYPGATLPFGMVQLSPDTRLEGWDGCSGYHYSDSIIYGFSHTHLQGTGVSDYGDILFAPTNSTTQKGDSWKDRYSSRFKKNTEQAEPGYYTAVLEDFNLKAELTATTRVGIHRYTLLNDQDSITLFVDMSHRDPLLEYSFYPVSDSVIVGHRVSKQWANQQHVYFAARFSAPFVYQDQAFEMRVTTDSVTGLISEEMEYVPVFPLIFPKQKELLVRVAISGTSIDGALRNLQTETPHADFERYRSEAKAAWNTELSKIEIEGGTDDERTIFYTALYHTLTVPNTWSDVDGHYRGADMYPHQNKKHVQHTVFSLWDTYRAAHPLYTLIQQKRTGDFIRSFLNMHEQTGSLPVWELAACETDCMIGYHSVSVMADAWAKGLRDFDPKVALKAMTDAATEKRLGKVPYVQRGYVSSEDEPESVSKTLEYAYDDWCIAQFARAIGEDEVYQTYIQRAQAWKNVFDPATGHVRPKRQGGWVEPFDPAEVNFHFTEANSWQYTFHVPHDLGGMVSLFGGREKMLEKLEALFSAQSAMSGREQPDITGLIGQYAHGNEPSHHVAFVFNYLGKPSKTQELTRQICAELYSNAPDGLSGNEDCGQMSAWYVLASAGLYQMSPGNEVWTITSPIFEEVKINLENGKQFIIRSNGLKKGNTYIQSAKLNGNEMKSLMLSHSDIIAGGQLEIELGPEPKDDFDYTPLIEASTITEPYVMMAPVISAPPSFTDSAMVSVSCPLTVSVIEVSVNDEPFRPYTEPFVIYKTSSVAARVLGPNNVPGPISKGAFVQRDKRLSITFSIPYDSQYPAAGLNTWIDGIKGGNDFRTGEWQGWWGKDIEATIDMTVPRSISYVGLRCIQDIRPWIWFPGSVSVFTSNDGENFTSMGVAVHSGPENDYKVETRMFGVNVSAKCRYVRIVAKNRGVIPAWHPGAGNPTWIFADEIEIR